MLKLYDFDVYARKDVRKNDANLIVAVHGDDDSKLHINLNKPVIASRQISNMDGIRKSISSLGLASDMYITLNDEVIADKYRTWSTIVEKDEYGCYSIIEKDYYLIDEPLVKLSKSEQKIFDSITDDDDIVYLSYLPLKLSHKRAGNSIPYFRISRGKLEEILSLPENDNALRESIVVYRQNKDKFHEITLDESLNKAGRLEYYCEKDLSNGISSLPDELKPFPMVELKLEGFTNDDEPIWIKKPIIVYHHNDYHAGRVLIELTGPNSDNVIKKLSETGELQVYETVCIPGKSDKTFIKEKNVLANINNYVK